MSRILYSLCCHDKVKQAIADQRALDLIGIALAKI